MVAVERRIPRKDQVREIARVKYWAREWVLPGTGGPLDLRELRRRRNLRHLLEAHLGQRLINALIRLLLPGRIRADETHAGAFGNGLVVEPDG